MLAVAVLASLVVQAQSLPEPLVQAARKAVETNPEVQARWNAFKAAVDERGVPRGGFFPQLDLTASTGRESRVTPLSNMGNYDTNSMRLAANQILFDGLFTPSEFKRLGYAKLTRYYELADISETTTLGAVQAYADVVRYRELVDAATQNYVEHKQTQLHVEERANAGVGRRADVEQATGRLALAESNLLTELTNLHDASARYLRIVGENPPTNLPTLPDPFKLGTLPDSTEALMRDGLQKSPVLNAAFENVRAYKQAVTSSKAPYMPRLDIRAYRSWDQNLLGVIGNTDSTGVQLVLNYNLFRGGSDMAKTSQTVKQAEQARDLQEKACRDVRQTLSIAYSDVQNLNRQLRYRDQHRLSTEKSREAYRQQFDIGQRTLLDLLDSQNEFFEATRAYINAHYNQIVAQARTLAGMGQLVASLGVTRTDVPSAQDAGQDRDNMDATELCPLLEAEVDSIEKRTGGIPPRRTGSYVVLLPSPDGTVGRVIVQGKGGEQELTKALSGTLTDGSTKPFEVGKEQMALDFGAAMAARPPLPESFLLYFNSGTTDLTGESKALLPRIMARIHDRKALDMSVIGHTDTVGKAPSNEVLGLQRANVIAKQIQELAPEGTILSVESNGERNLLVPTPDEKNEPRNRRVEVTLR